MIWRRSKYKNQKQVLDGRSFASKLEAAVYTLLKARENIEEIKIIQQQDHIYLTDARILYVPDFKCLNIITGDEFWVEAKGMETPEWRIKRRLWMHYGPGRLEIYMGTHARPFLKEVLNFKETFRVGETSITRGR